MDHKKIYVTKQMPLADAFNKADATARLYDVDVSVLAFSPCGQPYLFGSPCFKNVVNQNTNLKKERKSSSSKQSSILKYQAKLDRVMKEVDREKERGKVLKKSLEETMKRHNIKEIEDQTLEELLASKKEVEMFLNFLNNNFKETDPASSQFMPSKNKKNHSLPLKIKKM
ncbi:unnamed protein product [Arabis nemorensis]|uniref:MADS-box domain-containing protein n=1 Tax=Arabis nemorensis TaxID=586526 RepID=A0A565C389_9BRAS|nr:unnamed protein product [Arabis nemorensis]